MTAATLASPAGEVRRLRAALEQLHRLVAELLAAETGPLLELETARQWAAAAFRRGYDAGVHDGYVAALADMKRAQHDLVDSVRDEVARWHLCCRDCRRVGHQPGCTRCEGRTRATFSRAHPSDFPGRVDAA
jgi:hypothetical protein